MVLTYLADFFGQKIKNKVSPCFSDISSKKVPYSLEYTIIFCCLCVPVQQDLMCTMQYRNLY